MELTKSISTRLACRVALAMHATILPTIDRRPRFLHKNLLPTRGCRANAKAEIKPNGLSADRVPEAFDWAGSPPCDSSKTTGSQSDCSSLRSYPQSSSSPVPAHGPSGTPSQRSSHSQSSPASSSSTSNAISPSRNLKCERKRSAKRKKEFNLALSAKRVGSLPYPPRANIATEMHYI